MEDLYVLLDKAETNEDYRVILEKLRWADGFTCPRCGERKAYRIHSRKLLECSSCRAQVSATSGTFLHGVKNLGSWVKAILSFLQSEGKSTVVMAGLLNRSYVTTWYMMQKIRMVLGERLISHTEEAVLLPCSILKAALFKASAEEDLLVPAPSFSSDEGSLKCAAFLVGYLLGVFQGVSRKYSQLYAFEHKLRRESYKIEVFSFLACFLIGRKALRREILGYRAPYMIVS